PTNYVIEDGTLYEFDTGAVLDALTAADRAQLLRISEGWPDAEMLKAVQRFFYERRAALLPWTVNGLPVLDGVARFYLDRVGQAANHEGDGWQNINRLEIDRTGFDPLTRAPVLYGSSLKGAIRTALLDALNDGHPLQITRDPWTGREFPENNLQLQQRLFQFRAGSFEQDPLRLVCLADASWQGEPGLPSAQVCLAVNRKKAPVRDKEGRLLKPMAENLYQILECVPAWSYRAFAGEISVQCVTGVPELSRRGRRQLPASDLRFRLADIARACNGFYRPVLGAETAILRERGYLDPTWDEAMGQVMAAAEGRMARGEVFLLRVGRHSGAESVTVRGARNGKIKIMEGKDPATGRMRFGSGDTAKTLWLAAEQTDQTHGLLPFGWLLVECEPADAGEFEWGALRDVCGPARRADRAWAERQAGRRAAWAEARAEAERRRVAEEAAERERVEAEARAQREAAERQAVEAFRDFYVRQKAKGAYKPVGVFDEKRLALFKAALGFEDIAARRDAAALIRETIKDWTQWPSKAERKGEFRAWLEQLEREG
ncbi:hypothetical protein, partial [Methylomagnum sp.]